VAVSESNSSAPYRSLSVILIIVGGLLFVTAICSGAGYLVLPLVRSLQEATNSTALLSVASLAAAYGAILTFIGLSWRRRQPSPVLQLPSPLVWIGAYVGVLVLGQVIYSLGIGTAYLFPPFHVLAGVLIPIAILAFASRRLSPVSLRSVVGQFSWGGLVTIALALVFELLIGGVFLVLSIVAAALIIGTDRTMALLQELQSNVTDPESALRVVSAEPLLLLLAGSTVVLLFVLVIPLLEELIKAAGPAIAISRRIRTSAAPTKSEVIMWGLAAGAGFAFTENVLNTQGVLTGGDGLGGLWAGAMLLRVGTTCMHMVTTGTVAVGWYYALVERRRSRMLLLLAAATVAHAVWNTAAIALGGIAVMTTANPDLGFVAGCLAILALFLLFGLFAAFVYWLVRLIRWAQPPPVEIITSSGRYLEIKG
jgi:hypothetical protein